MLEWQSAGRSLVIIKSNLKKAFCAGGDVKAQVKMPSQENLKFIRQEYTLNHLIATYRIPYVAFINGITMGAGAGLSIHGKYRVATENTIFAMPETLLGFFPDVGGSYFLSRLPGQIGMYLGLTSDQLKGGCTHIMYLKIIVCDLIKLLIYLGRDVLFGGVATHYCEYARLGELEAALLTCSNSSEIELTLSKFCPVDRKSTYSLESVLPKINEYFSKNSVEDIMEALENDNSEWAQRLLKV